MKYNSGIVYLIILVAIMAFLFSAPQKACAHCDTLDGPVVKAAQKALDTGNVNLVLIWVQKKNEAEIKNAFEKTLAVRKLNSEAQGLADRYFFETLVRVHRTDEGAPYTGLKPASSDIGKVIPAADKAIANGKVEALLRILTSTTHKGVHEKFKQVRDKKNFNTDDVEAGREYVKVYVTFVHYVEGIYQAAQKSDLGHHDSSEESSPQNEAH